MEVPAGTFCRCLLLPSVPKLLVPSLSLLFFPGLYGLPAQDEPAPALLQTSTLQAKKNRPKSAFCTCMNPDPVPLHSHHLPVAWADAKMGPCIALALLLLMLMTLALFCLFFPFFFLADISSEPGLGWVIIACAGASPGSCVCRCHVLNPPIGSSQGTAVPREGLALPRGWGTLPAWHNLPLCPSPASPRKTFLLEIHLKKKICWTKKNPNNQKREER